jgi:hypothetical protein
VSAEPAPDATAHRAAVEQIHAKVSAMMRPHPYLHGRRSVFGVMPDWNPAEIIGVRPRPLALSLYKDLVTDSIWAYQRDNYGYRNLRSFPLLVSFAGLPYIDVRVSFNSFIPADVDSGLAERLTNYYMDRLVDAPSNHDKVEFEIIFSCYTLDLPARLSALGLAGFSAGEIEGFTGSLRRLTNGIIHGERGLWRRDVEKIHELEARRAAILGSDLDRISRIYWLLEDCKRYGTLPFAGLARAGFIAVQLLRSLVSVGILTEEDYQRFMASLETVSSSMTRDFNSLSKEEFLVRYGHLRPGTYDITSPRYDEAPELYFDWTQPRRREVQAPASFALSLEQLRRTEALLDEHGLEHDVLGLFGFIKGAIEGREYAKFVFTKSLSDILDQFKALAAENGFSVAQCAYADISCIKELYASSAAPGEVRRLHRREARRRRGERPGRLGRAGIRPPRRRHRACADGHQRGQGRRDRRWLRLRHPARQRTRRRTHPAGFQVQSRRRRPRRHLHRPGHRRALRDQADLQHPHSTRLHRQGRQSGEGLDRGAA